MSTLWEVWEAQADALALSTEERLGLSFINGALSQFRPPPGNDPRAMFLVPAPAWSAVEPLGSRMGSGGIHKALEEFVFRLGAEVPLREIRLPGVEEPITFLRPRDHGVLLGLDNPLKNMWSAHRFYHSFVEAIGAYMRACGLDAETAHLASILYIQIESATDRRGMAAVWELVARGMTPIYRFLCNFQHIGTTDELRGFQPLQMSLNDFGLGLDQGLLQALWSVQGALLHPDVHWAGPKIQDDTPSAFFSACCVCLARLAEVAPDLLRHVDPTTMLEDGSLLAWGGFDRAAMIVEDNWGWPTQSGQLPARIDRITLKVFLLYTAVAMHGVRQRAG